MGGVVAGVLLFVFVIILLVYFGTKLHQRKSRKCGVTSHYYYQIKTLSRITSRTHLLRLNGTNIHILDSNLWRFKQSVLAIFAESSLLSNSAYRQRWCSIYTLKLIEINLRVEILHFYLLHVSEFLSVMFFFVNDAGLIPGGSDRSTIPVMRSPFHRGFYLPYRVPQYQPAYGYQWY